MSRGRGRPPSPAPLMFWRVRLDVEPPQIFTEHQELAKLLGWQIALVQQRHEADTVINEPLTGIRTHIEADDGEKHRFLRRFGTAALPVHGWLILEKEPPPGSIAIVRIRGAELPPVAELPLSRAEKIDKNLYEQPADQLARAAFERDDVREMLLKMLQAKPTNNHPNHPHSEKKKGR